MIGSDQAKAAARRAMEVVLARRDRMLHPWLTAGLGEPLLVTTPDRRPAYWIVPVERSESVLGAIEIGLDGQLRGELLFYSDAESLAGCPKVVTGLTAEEALERAGDILAQHAGAELLPAAWVLDDVRQRPAWMLEVRQGGRWVSRVFVTVGEVWERRPNHAPPEPGIRG